MSDGIENEKSQRRKCGLLCATITFTGSGIASFGSVICDMKDIFSYLLFVSLVDLIWSHPPFRQRIKDSKTLLQLDHRGER